MPKRDITLKLLTVINNVIWQNKLILTTARAAEMTWKVGLCDVTETADFSKKKTEITAASLNHRIFGH